MVRRNKPKSLVASGGEAKGRSGGRRRLLADEVARAIVERAARGIFKPGQRLIETEVARELGVSRLPLREALKSLESQGIVTSTPHRGTRLMDVGEVRFQKLLDVRMALEMLAIQRAIPNYQADPRRLSKLDRVIRDMEKAAQRNDRFRMAECDVRFHHELCVAAGNEVLVKMWDGLSRQLLIAFGDPVLGNPDTQQYMVEHTALRNALAQGDLETAGKALHHHIVVGWRLPSGELRTPGRSRTRDATASSPS